MGKASFPQLIQVNPYLPVTGETPDTEGKGNAFFCRGKCRQSLACYMQLNLNVTFYTSAQTNNADYRVDVVDLFCRFGGGYFSEK